MADVRTTSRSHRSADCFVATMATRLWITSHAHLELEEVEKKAEAAGHGRKDGGKTVVATNVGKKEGEEFQMPKASCNVAFAVVDDAKDGSAVMATCAKLVRPQGTVYVKAKQASQELCHAALLAGLVEAHVEEEGDAWIVAKTPAWEVGASAPLRVRLNLADDVEEELVDEDELLTEADRMRPEPQARGCKTARKACANCSCGRAEAEEKAKLKGEDLVDADVPVSACGSCGLGDAFRCGTCPYRGLPPFKPGEKVSINQGVLAADI